MQELYQRQQPSTVVQMERAAQPLALALGLILPSKSKSSFSTTKCRKMLCDLFL